MQCSDCRDLLPRASFFPVQIAPGREIGYATVAAGIRPAGFAPAWGKEGDACGASILRVRPTDRLSERR